MSAFVVSGMLAQAAEPHISSFHLLAPTALRCANQTDPLAVADAKPEFSWQLTASSTTLHGVAQTAFEIRVGRLDSPIEKESIWDSGVVHSSEIAGIRYAGPALIPQETYEWRVRVWDEHNHPSAWSSYAHWTQAPDWHPQWIAAPPFGAGSEGEALPIFRKSFALEEGVWRATLYASGLGQDELRLNGQKVGDDELAPGWSDYHKTVYYDTYDVTGLLHGGENALGVLLGNGMYRVLKTAGRYTKFTGTYGPPKCTVLLHVEFGGGRSLDISSDGTWKTIPGPIVFSSTYGGEDYDARRERQGWDGPGFDDSQWYQATLADGPGGTLMPETPPPSRIMHIYSPIKVCKPKPGVTVYDLGQNFAGWPEISVAGPAGAKVKLIPGELLNGDGTVSQRSSGGPQWFTYVSVRASAYFCRRKLRA